MALVARIVPLLCTCLLLLSGCASIERVTDEEDEADEAAETARALAEVETFDVDQYPLEAPERVVDVTHRVPAQLMEVRAAAGVERTVDGYRVQIFSTDDRRAADEVYTEAEEWWASNRDSDKLREVFADAVPEEPPVHLIYRQPLYRVRVGNFTSQEQARELMAVLRDSFSDAFIARSPVTVRQ